jgi:hypothetical protein
MGSQRTPAHRGADGPDPLTIERWRERFRLRREMEDLRLDRELERTLAHSLFSPPDNTETDVGAPGHVPEPGRDDAVPGNHSAALACMR